MTPAPWTLPAHASLLTGLYPSRNGVKTRRDALPQDAVTLAEVLQGHGLRTAAIVNSHWLTEANGLTQGFDDLTYVKESVVGSMPSEVEAMAIDWLSTKAQAPFFLFLHFYDVHSDYSSQPEHESTFLRPYAGVVDGTTSQLMRFRRGKLDLEHSDKDHLVDLYDAGIRQMDEGLGRILNHIEELRLDERTLIVITADHGEEFLEHGGVLHGRTFFQEIVHVPLLIKGPGLPTAVRIQAPASLVDVVPTVLGVMGFDSDSALSGLDLLSSWREGGPEPMRPLFGEADWKNRGRKKQRPDIRRAVRVGHYKLHYDLVSERSQLFDLQTGRLEIDDLASSEPARRDILLALLFDFMEDGQGAERAQLLSPEEEQMLRSLGYVD